MNLSEIQQTYQNKLFDLRRLAQDLAQERQNQKLIDEIKYHTKQLNSLIMQYH